MASSMRQDETLSLSEDLTCAICCDLFQEPVMLGCMHHFCRSCITTYWRDLRGPAMCPQCRKEFPKKQFQTNYLVAGLVEKVRASSSAASVRNLQVRSRFFLANKTTKSLVTLVSSHEVLSWHLKKIIIKSLAVVGDLTIQQRDKNDKIWFFVFFFSFSYRPTWHILLWFLFQNMTDMYTVTLH